MTNYTDSALDWVEIGIGLLGGLALFLYGMESMTGALKTLAGGGMRTVLQKLTRNRVTGALTGAIVTAVVQSSSVTTVLVVGFVSTGLMTLQQSVGVILGANVGTTITAQIIAFKVTDYALVMIAVGFFASFVSKRDVVRRLGVILLGLGLVFYGMGLMSDATTPLRTYQPFIDAMARMDSPLYGVLVAAAFTALVQSSSATTGIVIVLAGQGFITLDAGIVLTLGANVGTCVTALLAAIGKPRSAIQAGIVHVTFNLGGVLLWLGAIPYLAEAVRAVSPSFEELTAGARLAAETPRQIANAHTLFNVANLLLFLPFTGWLAKLALKLAPDLPAPVEARIEPEFLDEVYLATPALGVDRVRMEVVRLGRLVTEAVRREDLRGSDERVRGELRDRCHDVEQLHEAIVAYVRSLTLGDLSAADGDRLGRLLEQSNDYGAIADTVATRMIPLDEKWDRRGLHASEDTRAMFRDLHLLVVRSLSEAADAIEAGDAVAARAIVERKAEIHERIDRIRSRLGLRLRSGDEERVSIYRLESEALEQLRQVFYFCRRIAKSVARPLPDSEQVEATTG